MRRVMLASVGSAVALVAVAGYADGRRARRGPRHPHPRPPGRRADPHGLRHAGRRCCSPSRPPRRTRCSPTPAPTRPCRPGPVCGRRSPRHPTTRRSTGGTGISVRDGVTGEELWSLDAGTPRVPASTQKLMAALAVADGLDLDDRMTTAVVARARLGRPRARRGRRHPARPGRGRPRRRRRPGRAGRPRGAGGRLARTRRGAPRCDCASTSPTPPGRATRRRGTRNDVRDGFTQAVVMTGLATQLPRALHPSPAAPGGGGGHGPRRRR